MDTTYYTSLSGEKVKIYPEEKIFEYSKEDLQDLLSCPISFEWLQNPVVYNGNVYEYKNIKEWLDKSNTDPITRQEVSGEQKFYPFNLLKFIMYAMEEDKDKLKFHSPPNSIMFAHEIGSTLPVAHYQNNYNHMEFGFAMDNNPYNYDKIQDISILGYYTHGVFDSPKVFKGMSLDRFAITDTYQDVKFENCYLTNVYPMERVWEMSKNCKIIYNLQNYSLVDYLFTSQITGKRLNEGDIFLSDHGHTIDTSFLEYKGTRRTFVHGSYYINGILSTEWVPIKTIMTKFQSALNYKCMGGSQKIFEPSFENFRNNGVFQTRCTEPIKYRVDIGSFGQKIYQRLEYIKEFIQNSDESNILEQLSEQITNDNIGEICNSCKYCCEQNIVNKFKSDHGIPFIDQQSTLSSPDFGLLNISFLELKKCTLKYIRFSGSRLKHTKFIDCKVDNCCFTGCDLTKTRFINCRIVLGKLWYKTKISHKTFVNCTINHVNNFEKLACENHLNISDFEIHNQFFIN